ncbi:MAG: four-helix bundle copper-binding protein [Fibrobacteres bacterium]|nr:four-helix bundle copper-binding protein [Fibrobacterota bacterium]
MANQTISKVIQTSLECAQACDSCASQALSELENGNMARCIRLCMDCAEICLENVRLIRRDSELQIALCHLCMEACDLCAEECRRHARSVDVCRICAEACELCAVACKNMARAMAEA